MNDTFLKAQAKAGGRALMLFDSHAGALGPRDYQEFNAELGRGVSVQGNVEPHVVFQSEEQIRERVRETLDGGKHARGHVFNLGHGVPQGAPVDRVKLMVDTVHEYTRVS